MGTQSQLVFQEGHDECIDACCIITPGRFVTGSQDGSIALWSTAKKNPLQKESNVHLSPDPMDVKHQKGTLRHWIVSLSAKHNCDVFASGSSDGVIKLWTVRNNSFYHLRSIRIPKGGFVNCMQWSDSGKFLICGLGTEHRLGRWEHVNGARNGIAIIKLPVGWEDKAAQEEREKQRVRWKKKMATKKGKDGRVTEQKDIEFEDAEEWDKWDPREKGAETEKTFEEKMQNGDSNSKKKDADDEDEG